MNTPVLVGCPKDKGISPGRTELSNITNREFDAMETNRTAWNRHAPRYVRGSDFPAGTVDYHGIAFPTEADLQLIGDPTGLRVLELGAGACHCGIALAMQGAAVTCLDLSEEMLALGQQAAQAAGVRITPVSRDMQDLSCFPDNAFDLVLSVQAIQYVEDLDSLFTAVARVLAPGGRFLFSTDHPVMGAVGATELWPEDGDDPRYTFRGPVRWKWREDDDYWFTTFRRPVMDYVNALSKAGLCPRQTHELTPSASYPGWSEQEAAVRERYPSTLVMLSQKL
jgi:SAM-dependent methyltransferase